MGTTLAILTIMAITAIIYGIYKLTQIYFLKKYPPGSGEIITTNSSMWYKDPKDVKHYRIIKKERIDKGRYSIDYSKRYDYITTAEVWE